MIEEEGRKEEFLRPPFFSRNVTVCFVGPERPGRSASVGEFPSGTQHQ